MRPFLGRMPMIACAVTDLPEPDSPTSATVEPSRTRNDKRSSTGARVPRTSNSSDRSLTSSRLVIAHPGAARPRHDACVRIAAAILIGRVAWAQPCFRSDADHRAQPARGWATASRTWADCRALSASAACRASAQAHWLGPAAVTRGRSQVMLHRNSAVRPAQCESARARNRLRRASHLSRASCRGGATPPATCRAVKTSQRPLTARFA